MVTTARPLRPKPDRTRAVVDAVERYELAESPAWSDLDALSTHTYLDDVEVDPEGIIFETEDRFNGIMNVYVMLEYGGKGDDGFKTSDSFLGTFNGHFDQKNRPVIDCVKIDTSPFYGDEPETT